MQYGDSLCMVHAQIQTMNMGHKHMTFCGYVYCSQLVEIMIFISTSVCCTSCSFFLSRVSENEAS